jgi:phenylalanyl-tRNA synthetase beta chain
MKEIVCGGLNARPGLVTAYAPIGAFIPGSGITLVPKPVRGVVSNGMLCSGGEMVTDEDPFRLRIARFEDWQPRAQALGLSDEQAIADGGIIELPDNLKVGSPVADALALDTVVDFEVTPNRPDWLGVTGIARDLGAKGIGKFALPEVKPVPGKFKSPVTVRIEDESACPVFAGRLIRGVKNGPSPEWMQKRLRPSASNRRTCWSMSPTTSPSTAPGRCTSMTRRSSKAPSTPASAPRPMRSKRSMARPMRTSPTCASSPTTQAPSAWAA